MLKFGDRVTAPRSWVDGSSRVTGVIINIDEEDERGWWYHVCCPDGPATWTHKDETVLEPDPERGAQDESIAQLTLELADTQAKLQLSEERVSILCSQLTTMTTCSSEWGDRLRDAEKEHDKAQATITTLKALVISVSDASAAKEAIWFATEAYNAKAEKARGTLAALKAQEGTLSWYSPERGE